MSVATVVMIVESALLAIALIFVVALLRSHAEILRRLAAIDGGADVLPTGAAAGAPAGGAAGGSAATGGVASDIAGQTLAGDAVKFALGGGGAPRTLVAFLSSGCAACGPLWAGLRDGRAAPAGARLIVVTKGPDRESPSRLRDLAPDREVVMSTAAWDAFAVPATPHFVLVDGAAGEILGRGSATSWDQIETLLVDAEADAAAPGGLGTSQRAARAEQALATAGIGAGHPSLYPSRGEESGDRR